jgi:hypothetical protein
MLERTWTEVEYRLDIVRATQEAHVETYWFFLRKCLICTS